MRPFSSITNLFSAVLPFLLLDVLDYKANASPMRNLSETATSSSASQLNGRGQPLVSRMTIGYAYWHEAQCQDYDIKALWDLSRAYVVLSPVPKYDAEVYANVQDGSCECIFEADKDQVLDSKMQYAFPPRGKTLESSTITFLRHRYRIPGMVLKRGNTKNLNIRLECKMHCKEIISFTSLFFFFPSASSNPILHSSGILAFPIYF
ncbi:hypothetical protein GGU10DRAFT_160489 [Lentinula aff. detonsa]|uniref:Uncharacterized protein n=1 Tax=Lentinula aff. detonsa TaxID=2804958 RepID=A0AA38KAW9_9AGAR|nr:hypothetical protein GGU10DRAFT_160489 [Lentinula aff. detonsa]